MKAFIYSNNNCLVNTLIDSLVKSDNFEPTVFDSAEKCIENLKQVRADLILLEAGSDCLKIIEYVKSCDLKSVICLVSNDELHCLEAYRNGCDGFILTQKLEEDMEHCLDNFRLLSKRIKRIHVVTFGRFNIFIDGEPVNFRSSKAKELVALCIDHRGGEVGMEEAIDKLWPEKFFDDKTKRLYRKAVANIKSALSFHGAEDIFVKKRGCCFIRSDAVECDYFSFLDDPEKHISEFKGEYMYDYSWSEQTLAALTDIAAHCGKKVYCL